MANAENVDGALPDDEDGVLSTLTGALVVRGANKFVFTASFSCATGSASAVHRKLAMTFF